MSKQIDPRDIWIGPFETWVDAKHACGDLSGWASSDWINRQTEFFEATAQQILPPRPSALPLLARALGAKTIVDWGGASGWLFSIVERQLGSYLESYEVMDLVESVDAFKHFQRLDSRLKFFPFSSTESLPGVDLLYANASLHYAESISDFTDYAVSHMARHIVLDQYLATDELELYLVHRVYGIEVPVRIPLLEDTLNTLISCGYEIRACVPVLGPVLGQYRYDLPLEHMLGGLNKNCRYTIIGSLPDSHHSN